ncbi:PAS domain S-box protein [Tardiphaga sp. vice352]|uniref:sensor histidine kinase n=1 Tax=unclassified Tardiphaga TaxID=2631404 RepID=UPI001163DA1C|nr:MULTISPECIES: PAS domain S-box protein [unclassified Tardiphaga]QDM18101.1 PAS domain S-box protein [Tardiphaga sp. vice278]QDM23136.1 PAS domain S-box protein [Tardiphaga sp. vice154]QDM28307.1 PAS domain S-box protein [Tardiphaga sp. vice304]QDM33448.1 PAS domain S-box protein [Tardiphaga sp. vice352]
MDILAKPQNDDDPVFRVALRQSEIRYRRLFEAAHDGVLILDCVSRKITDANPFMSQLLGYRHEELLGKELWEIGLLKDEQASQAAFRELQNNGHVRYEDLPLESKSGEKREVEVVANRYDEDGTQVVQCNVRDITERKKIEDALRSSEERFRTLFELGPSAVYACDARGVIRDFNQRATELWGRTPARGDDSERFCGSMKMFRPDGSFMPHDQCPMAEVVSGELAEVNDEEVVVERPDGSRVTAVVNIRPLKNEHGEVTGAINCAYDITERKQVEEHQRFLMGELAHRGGNLLAVIQSIVSRSLAGTKPLAEERNTLIRRLQALARSQSALMSKGFQGAPLAEIVRLEFEAFTDRVTAKGPDVMLNSRAAQTFALLLHELATNATKYGALSLPDKGEVDIHWSIDGEAEEARFKFQWQERDGPPVVVPARKGFGSLLLDRLASQDFGAQPTIAFAPGGLSYSIDASLPTMTAGSERTNLLRSTDYART